MKTQLIQTLQHAESIGQIRAATDNAAVGLLKMTALEIIQFYAELSETLGNEKLQFVTRRISQRAEESHGGHQESLTGGNVPNSTPNRSTS